MAPPPNPHTVHSCYGERTAVRSCLFRNLYWSRATKRLTYFMPEPRVVWAGSNVESSRFMDAAMAKDTHLPDAHFLRWPASKFAGPHPIDVEVVVGTPPENTSHLSGVSVLWEFFPPSDYSYGHCMVNDWFPMTTVVANHFVAAAPPFRVLTLSPFRPKVCARYIEACTLASVVHLQTKMEASGHPWMRFDYLIAGEGGYWAQAFHVLQGEQPLNVPTGYNPDNWFRFREAVFRWSGLPARTPTAAALPCVIAVNDKAATDRRRIQNVEAVVASLRNATNCTVLSVSFEDLSPRQQLEVMGRTTVFITTQGSSAFRLVFLPVGAHTIMIGSLPIPGSVSATTPFFELSRHFTLNHVVFLRYLVLDPKEVERLPVLTKKKGGPDFKRLNEWRQYNAHVVVDPARLRRLVAQALYQVMNPPQPPGLPEADNAPPASPPPPDAADSSAERGATEDLVNEPAVSDPFPPLCDPLSPDNAAC
eukprot:EG_transcript_10261